MATRLPFNQILLDGAVVAGPEDFVYGTGSLLLAGQDSAVTTADGMIHNYRSALTPSASCNLRGDKRLKDSGAPGDWDEQTWPAMSGTVKLQYVPARGETATDVAEFSGLIGVEYDSSNNQSSVNIAGCEAQY